MTRSVKEIEAEMVSNRKSGELANMAALYQEWLAAKKATDRKMVRVAEWCSRS